MTGAHGMTSSLRLGDQLDYEVPGEIGEHMLNALREALSNAARHGQARHVDIGVSVGSQLVLVVSDNGSGIKDTSRRSGLANLARRAEQYGGALTVGPASGGGTELRWQVPLPGTA
jgi:signal transduction histidine kinase